MHAQHVRGQLLNLEPDTAYECRFTLTDPDGVRGTAVKVVEVRTRKIPTPTAGGRIFHVYPYGYAGPKARPAFTGLLAAYYMGSDQSDHSNALPPRVRSGDVILVHAGVYKDNRFAYGGFDPQFGGYGTPFDGTYYLTQSGTPDRPIVIKAAGDGEVVFDGDGNQTLFKPDGRQRHLRRGDHGPQHQRRLLAGAEGHRRRQRLFARPFTSDRHRPRGARTTGRAPRTSTSPTTSSSAGTTGPGCRAGSGPRSGRSSPATRRRSPRNMR